MSDQDPKPVKEEPAGSGNQDPKPTEEEHAGSGNQDPKPTEEEHAGSGNQDPKPTEEEPAGSGNQDPSTEAEEDTSIENGSSSVEDKSTLIGEEGSSTENGSPTVKDESTPLGEEGSSTENGSPTVKDESTPLGEEGSSTENGNTSFEDESTPVGCASIEDESAPTIAKTPSVEEKYPAVEEEPTAEEERPAIEEERPTAEEECATADKESSPKEEHTPGEKECQADEEELVYIEPKTIVIEHNDKKDSSVTQDECFDRSIQTTLQYEISNSTSSHNAQMGDDSASSLKECPSIEDEPEPEPIVGEILRVQAQVMVRNDSTGGWVPEGRGGMSTVTILKIETPVKPGEERRLSFLVKGKRLSDQKDTLACTLYEDFEYNKVMPTFHHWKTGNKRFGLTFQTKLEAKSFDKILRKSAHERQLIRDPNAVPVKVEGDDDDDFLAFTKPAEPKPDPPPPKVADKLPEPSPESIVEEEKIEFMQLTSLPEYFYQDLRKDKASLAEEKLKRRPYYQARKPLKYFGLIRRSTRLRCKFCHELFEEEDNKRGSCHYAPNKARSWIHNLSCMHCTKWVVQDCMLDVEDENSQPCNCNDDGFCGIRWLGLSILSFFIPCIMLYPPMKGCYYCGVRCGACGERHEPKDPQPTPPEL